MEQIGDRHHKVFIVVHDKRAGGCLLPPFHWVALHGTWRGIVQEL
jgi:hypothetical protein